MVGIMTVFMAEGEEEMRESQFLTELIHSLKAHGAWAFKIADTPASMVMGLRYVPTKPCDIIGCYKGKFFAIEGKQMKAFKAFGVNAMRLSQIENLTEINNAQGKSFVFLNIRIKGVKGEKKQANRLVVFDWEGFKAREESIKKKELLMCDYIKGKGGLYDLEDFLEGL